MRETILLMLLVLGALPSVAQPQVEITPKQVQLGELSQQSEPLHFDYTLVNVGDEPLLIHFVRTSCSCTKATYTRRPVMPGDTTRIGLSYDPRKQPLGAVRRVVSITTNATPAESKVIFKGRIVE